MLALLRAWRSPGAGRLALAGLALGVAMLVRADLLILPVVLGAAWLLLARALARHARRGGRGGAARARPAARRRARGSSTRARSAGRVIPIASSGPSTLFVGTYLPGRRQDERRAARAGALRLAPHAEPARRAHRQHQGRVRAARLHPRAPPGADPRPLPRDPRRRPARGAELRGAAQPQDLPAPRAGRVRRHGGAQGRAHVGRRLPRRHAQPARLDHRPGTCCSSASRWPARSPGSRSRAGAAPS